MPTVAASVIPQVETRIFPVSVIYNKCWGCLEPSLCIAKCVVHSSLGRDGMVEPAFQPITGEWRGLWDLQGKTRKSFSFPLSFAPRVTPTPCSASSPQGHSTNGYCRKAYTLSFLDPSCCKERRTMSGLESYKWETGPTWVGCPLRSASILQSSASQSHFT